MVASITHRITGIALYGGAAVVAAWLACAAAGPAAYGGFADFGSSIIGLIVWIGLTLSAAYHFAAGVRHLIWDTGAGLNPRTASAMATLSIWFAVVVTIAFWIWMFASQHVIWNGRIFL
jgi:succinate dehydrogenase / fumarate reductase cytochrome b subunit